MFLQHDTWATIGSIAITNRRSVEMAEQFEQTFGSEDVLRLFAMCCKVIQQNKDV